MLVAIAMKPKCFSDLTLQFGRYCIRRIHFDGGIHQPDIIYQPNTAQSSSRNRFCSGVDLVRIVGMIPELVFSPVLVVGIVPIRVVEIVPALVVEMIPDLVVEIVPAKDVADKARTNVIVQGIAASFFIVLLLVIPNIGVRGRL